MNTKNSLCCIDSYNTRSYPSPILPIPPPPSLPLLLLLFLVFFLFKKILAFFLWKMRTEQTWHHTCLFQFIFYRFYMLKRLGCENSVLGSRDWIITLQLWSFFWAICALVYGLIIIVDVREKETSLLNQQWGKKGSNGRKWKCGIICIRKLDPFKFLNTLEAYTNHIYFFSFFVSFFGNKNIFQL